MTAILRAALELGVFDALAGGSARAEQVAAAISASTRGTRLLLQALAALDLLVRTGNTYSLAPQSELFLLEGGEASIRGVMRLLSHDLMWEAMRRLPEAVRRGGTVLDGDAECPTHTYWRQVAEQLGDTALAPASAAAVAALRSWCDGLERLEVLDLGCGSGILGYRLARAFPQAHVTSVDWPGVLEVSRANAVALGVADRTRFVAGDMFDLELGPLHDVVVISSVLHHLSPKRSRLLIDRAAGLVRPGGKLLLHEYLADADGRSDALNAALFSVVLLAWTREGEVHPLSLYRSMLRSAGFSAPQVHPVSGLPSRLLVADRLPR